MKNKYSFLLIAMMMTAACASKTKLLDVSAVSNTYPSIPARSKLVSQGPVTGQFCADSLHDRGTKGLMDEAIANAQSNHHVDFITEVTLWRLGNGCVQVEGTGQKIMASDRTHSSVPIR